MSENVTARVTPAREQIAEEIRALLARRRLSISELARKMGVTQPYLSRRLTGDVAIDVDDLYAIAALLGVEASDLMPREGRLIATAATTANTARVSNGRKTRPANRPYPTGRPKATTPDYATRRPVRRTPVHA